MWPAGEVCPKCGRAKLSLEPDGSLCCWDMDCDYTLRARCVRCPALSDCEVSGIESCCFGQWDPCAVDGCSVYETCRLVTGAGKGVVAVRSEL